MAFPPWPGPGAPRGFRRQGSSLAGAIVGVLVGIALLGVGIALLWWNEARPNPAILARTATVAPATRIDAQLEGRLVSVTADTQIQASLGDEFLWPNRWLVLDRDARMYAWVERCDRSRCTYDTQWTAWPQDSRRFRHPGGHDNPPMRVASQRWTVPVARIGAYEFAPSDAAARPATALAVEPSMVRPTAPFDPRVESGGLYVGDGSTTSPHVGDVSVRYQVAAEQLSTLFGAQHGERVVAFSDANARLYRLLPGPRDAAIAALAFEHRVVTWMFRLGGFFCIWIALLLFLGPVNSVLDFIPPLGRLGRALTAAITLPLALALTIAFAALSAVVHSAVALALILVAILLFVLVL